jgi:phage gp29-like protein
VPRSTNTTERAALLANLAKMVQDAVAVINTDESIELQEAGGKSASADIYDKLISSANREVSKAILGQTLTTEIDQGGSYAASKTHMEVRADLVDQDKRMVKGCLDQLIRWVVELNFAGAEAPEFVWKEEEDIQTDRAERDEKLKNQGVRFNKIYYARRYNLEEDEFEVTEPVETYPDATGLSRLQMPAGFAEGARKFTPDQQALEDMIDAAMPQASEARNAMTNAVLEAVQSATGYEDLQDRLAAALADRMPAADFEEMMARVMTAAHMWGRAQK